MFSVFCIFCECPLKNVFGFLNFVVLNDNLKSYYSILLLSRLNHNVEK
jgi:hypothetical protein